MSFHYYRHVSASQGPSSGMYVVTRELLLCWHTVHELHIKLYLQYLHKYQKTVWCDISRVQNYLVFGLSPRSAILRNRRHDITETGSVSVFRCGGEDTYSIGSNPQSKPQSPALLPPAPHWAGDSPPHLRMETDPVSETSCFIFHRIPNDEESPKTQ
jgi:hypothetical protein